MARRKSYKRSTHRRRSSGITKHRSRRRRIGATSALKFNATSPLVKYGSMILGYLKPDLLPISKLVGDKLDSKIVAGGEVGLGFLLAMRKGKKSLPMVILGGYMVGAGVKKAMTAFGIGSLGPYNKVPVIAGRRVNGPYSNMPVIGMPGYTPNHSLNGYTVSGKVMNGINTGGSGYNNDNPGSNYQG